MHAAYLAITIIVAAITAFSAIGKIRRDPKIVKVVHETVGVPMKYFGLLAALEFAGAAGLVIGIGWPPLGIAAAVGLVLYFAGAVGSHVRVGDFGGLGPAAFMLVLAAVAGALRFLTMG